MIGKLDRTHTAAKVVILIVGVHFILSEHADTLLSWPLLKKTLQKNEEIFFNIGKKKKIAYNYLPKARSIEATS